MLALLPLGLMLMLSILANSAAIPSKSLESHNSNSVQNSQTSQSPLTQHASADANMSPRTLAKRIPYYFPETVPDEQELAAHLVALREEGLSAPSVPQTPDQSQSQMSMGTRVLVLPDQEAISESHDSGESSWESEAVMFRQLHFLVIVAAVLCVVTIVQGIRHGSHRETA